MQFYSIALIAALCAGVRGIAFAGKAPGDETRLAAAQAAPCSTAIGRYESIAADTTVPDSVRARAFALRADYAFALREYETALDNYRKASSLDKKNIRYRFRSGLSLLADGDTAAAINAITPIADRNDPAISNEARVVLGRLAYDRSDFKAAMDLFRQTGTYSPTNGWSISASFGKLLCARSLGLADTAAFYEKQLSPYAKSLLEKQWLAKTREGTALKKADAGVAAAKPKAVDTGKDTAIAGPSDSSASGFTLQVGAFASEASALALKKQLAKSFKEVNCVSALVSARTFYRVWVGDFTTREAAEKFGQEELIQLGLVFRVVAK
jgi:tetratricopeptide (TPR) repeat protein